MKKKIKKRKLDLTKYGKNYEPKFNKSDKSNQDGVYGNYETSPEFYKYLEYPPFKTKEETKFYLLKLMDKVNSIYWFVRLGKKVIGTVGLTEINSRSKHASIGIGISPKYWGKGYGKEALKLAVFYGFNNLNLRRLQAITREDNLPTIKIFKSLGFEQEGMLREHYVSFDGNKYNAVMLGLIK